MELVIFQILIAIILSVIVNWREVIDNGYTTGMSILSFFCIGLIPIVGEGLVLFTIVYLMFTTDNILTRPIFRKSED